MCTIAWPTLLNESAMHLSTSRVFGLLAVCATLIVAGIVNYFVSWSEPVMPKLTKSFANARLVRQSQFDDWFEPLLKYSVEIVTTINTNYGKVIKTPEAMSIAVLVYVASYYGAVDRMHSGSGPATYVAIYRIDNPVNQFFMPIHLLDRYYFRPWYWHVR